MTARASHGYATTMNPTDALKQRFPTLRQVPPEHRRSAPIHQRGWQVGISGNDARTMFPA